MAEKKVCAVCQRDDDYLSRKFVHRTHKKSGSERHQKVEPVSSDSILFVFFRGIGFPCIHLNEAGVDRINLGLSKRKIAAKDARKMIEVLEDIHAAYFELVISSDNDIVVFSTEPDNFLAPILERIRAKFKQPSLTATMILDMWINNVIALLGLQLIKGDNENGIHEIDI